MAFPRFVNICAEAKVYASWGRIDDDRGAIFKMTIERTLRTDARLIQIATWNDWGEGTMIEPSREFGYRDLEVLQAMRRAQIDSRSSAQGADLRLPDR